MNQRHFSSCFSSRMVVYVVSSRFARLTITLDKLHLALSKGYASANSGIWGGEGGGLARAYSN